MRAEDLATGAVVAAGRVAAVNKIYAVPAGSVGVFWSNGLVGTMTTLAITLLFGPVIDKAFSSVGRMLRSA